MRHIRQTAKTAASANAQGVARLLTPYASSVLKTVMDDQLNARNVSHLVGIAGEQFLAKPTNRTMIAGGLVGELQKKVPQLTDYLRTGMREAALEYVERKFGFMAKMLGGSESIVDGIIDNLDWSHIEQCISQRLATEETQDMLAKEVGDLADRLREYLQTAEAQESVDQFIHEHSVQLENAMANYFQKKLPGMLENLLANEAQIGRAHV